MISSRGTKTVRLQRRKSGLEFSIKGGREHGIGVVVSWIKQGGAAAKDLRLGDEILALNGDPLFGLSHSQVVGKLRNVGSSVVLLIRPNQTLEDVFSATATGKGLPPIIPPSERSHLPVLQGQTDSAPLPQGWTQKLDQKTGRIYYENHYTLSSTWTDPRTRQPIPMHKFEWNILPPGWERFLDHHGDVYYVNHHTQTTHWDSPRESRQQHLLKQLIQFLRIQKEKITREEEDLASKRRLLLEKNTQLTPILSQSHDLKEEEEGERDEEGESQEDLYDDIMLLNEEVDAQDVQLSNVRRHYHRLSSILQDTKKELFEEKEQHHVGAELALCLANQLSKLYSLVGKLLELVEGISKLQQSKDSSTTPLHHMLQLPTQVGEEEFLEEQQWVHVLPDKLTAKTSCEVGVELAVVEEMVRHGESLQQELSMLFSHALSHPRQGWEDSVERLAALDFQLLQDPAGSQGIHTAFREKLEKLVTF